MNAKIIYGFPTTGKTYYAHWLRSRGVSVVDTDEVITEIEPRWWTDKTWRHQQDHGVMEERILQRVLNYSGVITTNFPGLAFKYPTDDKYFFIRDVQTAHLLSIARGQMIGIELLMKWHTDVVNFLLRKSQILLNLGPERYILDYMLRK